MAYERRSFAGGAVPSTLTSSINGSDLSISIADATGWPDGSGGDFFVVIDRGGASEEKVLIDTRSGTTLTVAASGRGVDGTSGVAHSSGASIEHCVTARDLDEANAHLSNQQSDPHPVYAKDSDVTSAIAVAVADYLPLAGGTMTGNVDFDGSDIDMGGGSIATAVITDATVTNAADTVYSANISGSVTIDADNGGTQALTLTGNVTSVAVSNLPSGGAIDILWIQDSTGGRTTSWPAAWYWVTNEAAATAVLATGANARNWLMLKRIGSDYYAFLAGNLTT